ncbi:CPBP family intramembrane glutamic endopeptidase [Staphylococcus agnetis]
MTISLIILPLIFEIFVYKNDRKSLGFILLNSSNKYNFCIYLITLFIYIAIIFSNINDFRNVLLLSVYVFIQCFGEEILFRSVIQRRLQLVMNSKWAIIFGTLIFVFLFHEDTMLNNLLFRTPIAIVLSYTFYKTKSIYPTTLIHFVYNLYYSI